MWGGGVLGAQQQAVAWISLPSRFIVLSSSLSAAWVALFVIGVTVVALIGANQKQLQEWNEKNQRSDSSLVLLSSIG